MKSRGPRGRTSGGLGRNNRWLGDSHVALKGRSLSIGVTGRSAGGTTGVPPPQGVILQPGAPSIAVFAKGGHEDYLFVVFRLRPPLPAATGYVGATSLYCIPRPNGLGSRISRFGLE